MFYFLLKHLFSTGKTKIALFWKTNPSCLERELSMARNFLKNSAKSRFFHFFDNFLQAKSHYKNFFTFLKKCENTLLVFANTLIFLRIVTFTPNNRRLKQQFSSKNRCYALANSAKSENKT